MKAVALVGYKKSGKTTLVQELTRELKQRGLKVFVCKHSHHGFDENTHTDTYRHKQLADGVAGWSPGESFISWPEEWKPADLLRFVRADVALVEGGKGQGWLPRIILAEDAKIAAELAPEAALAVYGPEAPEGDYPELEATTDIPKLADAIEARGFRLPNLNCGGCGREDCMGLTRDIVAGTATLAECTAMNAPTKVTVNGEELPLNPFVAEMLGGGLLGMLKSLKGYAKGKVVIELEAD